MLWTSTTIRIPVNVTRGESKPFTTPSTEEHSDLVSSIRLLKGTTPTEVVLRDWRLVAIQGKRQLVLVNTDEGNANKLEVGFIAGNKGHIQHRKKLETVFCIS